MMANVVEDLITRANGNLDTVAYFFCKHDILEGLKAGVIIAALTRQLLHPWPRISALHGTDTLMKDGPELLDMLWKRLPDSAKIYLVVDGLDQCAETEQKEVMEWMQKLQNLRCLYLCMSSRSHPDATALPILQGYGSAQVTPIPENTSDIDSFIDSELHACIQESQLKIGDPSLIIEIREALIRGSQGMFLWVALQIKSLCSMQSDADIREALKHLPQGLSETYDDILRRTSQSKTSPLVKYQQYIFELTSAAWRPLTIFEIKEALAVVPGVTSPDLSQSLNSIYATLSSCGCLVILDEEELTVRLVHPSLKQFLMEQYRTPLGSRFTAPQAHFAMAERIVTYLSYAVFRGEVSKDRIPEMDVTTTPSRIVASTVSSKAVQALALKFLRSARQPEVDVSRTLAEALESHRRLHKYELHFYQYTKTYCMQHLARVFEPGLHIGKLLPALLDNNTVSLELDHNQFDPLLFLVESKNINMFKIFYPERRGRILKEHVDLIAAIRLALEKDCPEILKLMFSAAGLSYNFWFKWDAEDLYEGPLLEHAVLSEGVQVVRFLLPLLDTLPYEALRDALRGGSEAMKNVIYDYELSLSPGGTQPREIRETILWQAVISGYQDIVEKLITCTPRKHHELSLLVEKARKQGNEEIVDTIEDIIDRFKRYGTWSPIEDDGVATGDQRMIHGPKQVLVSKWNHLGLETNAHGYNVLHLGTVG
ncbi:hypothetical protein GRF29_1g2190482 [Pseudopithomyces chartarum]|uniref:NACHT domain-containing protein n=1 Tax=Pseudopithomyces chartarum TaxID=1892770 RepID=A0AAN6RN86_9PLEO|nr:hypothetical protein GRF29_1g2190482 [Pseudopithomyces chartarum]